MIVAVTAVAFVVVLACPAVALCIGCVGALRMKGDPHPADHFDEMRGRQ